MVRAIEKSSMVAQYRSNTRVEVLEPQEYIFTLQIQKQIPQKSSLRLAKTGHNLKLKDI